MLRFPSNGANVGAPGTSACFKTAFTLWNALTVDAEPPTWFLLLGLAKAGGCDWGQYFAERLKGVSDL